MQGKALLALITGIAGLCVCPAKSQTVHNRKLVDEFVHLSFPHAKVTAVDQPKDDYPIKFYGDSPMFYEVAAPPEEDELEYATSLVEPENVSTRRLVHAKVISHQMPSGEKIFVASLVYSFLGIDHGTDNANRCEFVLIRKGPQGWELRRAYLEEANPSTRRVEFLDLDGDAVPELLVTADTGDYRWEGATLFVFDISHHGLQQIGQYEIELDAPPPIAGPEHYRYRKELDVAKTLATGGRKLVFRVTTLMRNDKLLPTPEISEETVELSGTQH